MRPRPRARSWRPTEPFRWGRPAFSDRVARCPCGLEGADRRARYGLRASGSDADVRPECIPQGSTGPQCRQGGCKISEDLGHAVCLVTIGSNPVWALQIAIGRIEPSGECTEPPRCRPPFEDKAREVFKEKLSGSPGILDPVVRNAPDDLLGVRPVRGPTTSPLPCTGMPYTGRKKASGCESTEKCRKKQGDAAHAKGRRASKKDEAKSDERVRLGAPIHQPASLHEVDPYVAECPSSERGPGEAEPAERVVPRELPKDRPFDG